MNNLGALVTIPAFTRVERDVDIRVFSDRIGITESFACEGKIEATNAAMTIGIMKGLRSGGLVHSSSNRVQAEMAQALALKDAQFPPAAVARMDTVLAESKKSLYNLRRFLANPAVAKYTEVKISVLFTPFEESVSDMGGMKGVYAALIIPGIPPITYTFWVWEHYVAAKKLIEDRGGEVRGTVPHSIVKMRELAQLRKAKRNLQKDAPTIAVPAGKVVLFPMANTIERLLARWGLSRFFEVVDFYKNTPGVWLLSKSAFTIKYSLERSFVSVVLHADKENPIPYKELKRALNVVAQKHRFLNGGIDIEKLPG